LWSDFGVPKRVVLLRLLGGFFEIVVVIAAWGVCAYGPCGWYVASPYAQLGDSPGYTQEFVVSMIVVVGNQLVCLSCDGAAKDLAPVSKKTNRLRTWGCTAWPC